MKYLIVMIMAVTFSASFTSCATANSIQKESEKVAGYTLKNKKELMQQKIADKKCKTVIALP
ncbi:MAG: hypothetical protein JKY22_07210 [Flavobacteriaceae bacterium]|nr:hypothetical protein [Flavobacteriaceae bacterium]